MIYNCENRNYDVILMLKLIYLKDYEILKSFKENNLLNVSNIHYVMLLINVVKLCTMIQKTYFDFIDSCCTVQHSVTRSCESQHLLRKDSLSTIIS